MATLSPHLRARLSKIPDVIRAAAAEAMEEGAEAIVQEMRARVPVLSGDLRDSIGWTWGDVPAGAMVIKDIRSGRNEGFQYASLSIKIYAGSKDAFYARYVEFGTRAGMPAQAFFFPVWRDKRVGKAAFRRRVRAAIRKAMKREFGGG